MRLRKVELLIILLSLALLGIVVVPFIIQMSRPVRGTGLNRCWSHVKEVALAERLWAGDNNERFSFEISTNSGGTKEYVQALDAFRHFLVMSNELGSPKVLTCPADAHRQPTTDFATFGNSNLSYFINLSARGRGPVSALSGDRNLQLSDSGANLTMKWGAGLHEKSGFIALTDLTVHNLNLSKSQQTTIRPYFTNAQLLFPP